MNRNTHIRSIARLAAVLGAGAVTIGLAGTAHAETPEEPIDVVDIADAPECTPWGYDGLTWYYANEGNNSLMFQVGYSDEVETCDEMVTLDIYTLASPTAQIDDPGSSLYFTGGYMLSVVEDATDQFGLHDWAASAAGECSEFRFEIGGVLISSERVTDDCADLPIAADPGNPDPNPGNPDDFVDGDGGQPDNPDDFDNGTPQGDQPDDGGVGQGGELPSTGTASTLLVLLAGALTTVGGFFVAGARRREA